jgi:dipeptidyl-peptidase-4
MSIRTHSASAFPISFVVLCALAACSTAPATKQSANGRSANSAAASHAGSKPLTFEALFGPKDKVNFSGSLAPGIEWLDAQRCLMTTTDPATKRTERVVLDAATGETSKPDKRADFADAIATIPGVARAEAEKLAGSSNAKLDAAREAQLVTRKKDLWIARRGESKALQLTSTPKIAEEEASWSPDGSRIAFVLDNDLYVADAKTGATTRLTQDGSTSVLNGKLDWLYQEEIFGRGTFRAYWWSPDSKSIAYLRLDQTQVPPYTIVDDGTYDVEVEVSPYPRAGEPNPTVALRIVEVSGGMTADVDLARYADSEPLVVNVMWSPDGRVVYQVQDREQRWLELRACAADATKDALLVRETSQAWVDRIETIHWLGDGTYLIASERTGWKHLYHYRGAELIGAVTSGEWEARDFHGVDEENGLVYFSGTERSHIGLDVYSVRLDGNGLKRLSQAPGTHKAEFNANFSLYEDTWSDIATPPQRRLHRASDGSELRVLDANPVETLAEYGFRRPELLEVKTRDGFVMEAMRILPPDYDASRRYPVIVFGYWGPHAPTVKDAWGGTNGMFQQLLAQMGVVVWSCDGRTSSGKGAVSTWPCYQKLGEPEMTDLLDGVQWLIDQGVADPERIGITGWSYGGFMTSYALTHSDKFALGLAGGSVTDWRNYDSVYTERFMRTPANNKQGYARTSVVAAASKAHGHLVLAHGAIDDNVHPGNTLQLTRALQKAEKTFELMLYPGQRHGVVDPAMSRHWKRVQIEAIERWLLRAGA